MNFTYLDNLPVMVLGIHYWNDDAKLYSFEPEYSPQLIVHQTGGHACHQHYIQGLILNIKPAFDLPYKLNKLYLDSDIGIFETPLLDQLNEYNKKLKQYKAYCNFSYRRFEEGIYPIDYDIEWLRGNVSDILPDDPDDMLIFNKDSDRFCGSVGRWGVYILGDNCHLPPVETGGL